MRESWLFVDHVRFHGLCPASFFRSDQLESGQFLHGVDGHCAMYVMAVYTCLLFESSMMVGADLVDL